MKVADIAMLVKEVRKSQGLKQTELALVAGVGERFVVELEAGKETLQVGKLLSVVQALGIKIEMVKPLC